MAGLQNGIFKLLKPAGAEACRYGTPIRQRSNRACLAADRDRCQNCTSRSMKTNETPFCCATSKLPWVDGCELIAVETRICDRHVRAFDRSDENE